MSVANELADQGVYFVALTAALAGWFSLGLLRADAQTCPTPQQGNNTIYANCSGSNQEVGSASFIDASLFGLPGTGTDICQRINAVLTSAGPLYPAVGAVIDARGINTSNSASSGGDLICNSNPWSGVLGPAPSVVLLPAGTIDLSAEWVLPDRTRLIGETNNVTTGAVGTTLKAVNISLPAMIEFCTAACSGVSVQNVFLNGNNLAHPGIENQHAGDLSYVDHVNFLHFQGSMTSAALHVAAGPDTQNSGPYSNLQCQPAGSGECIDFEGSSTRGVHGLTCTSTSSPAACVRLDGSNNSLQDIHIEGFVEGVVVGSNAATQDNVLIDINAGDGQGNVQNVIHIWPNTTDLNIFGLAAQSNTGDEINNMVYDQVTGTTIPGTTIPQPTATVGMYVLGNNIGHAGSGVPRFTTATVNSSSVTPTWLSGNGMPSSASGQCPVGSLYSDQTGTSGHALWLCVGPILSSTWVNLK
jgi:hypothetical protein